MGLEKYAAKRNFGNTPEPGPAGKEAEPRLRFVVQKHAARALHYDIRLELDGVLKSWACPKGPSLSPAVKRLAVMVEDHPLDYRDFEGLIPEGNYGAGGVIVWDRGHYRHPLSTDEKSGEQLLLAGLAKGDLKFVLEGEKLRGEFALVRTKRAENSWLLIKKKDEHASSEEVLSLNRSVISGLSLEELMETGAKKGAVKRKVAEVTLEETLLGPELESAPKAAMPHGVKPMLASSARAPFDDPAWLFEVKWDGYRAIAETAQGGVSLYSRNLLPFNEKFAPVAQALSLCRFESVLDGEIVAVDEQGNPSFQLLQDYPKTRNGHLLYSVFDLVHLNGHDLTTLPLIKRKEILKKILPPSPVIRFSDHVAGQGMLFFKAAKARGLEGIVAKKADSPYLPGKRSGSWLKVKTAHTQEGVIAGFTAPRGGRKHFGALILGAYENGELVCIGHAGGGFSESELSKLSERLKPLVQPECPFKVKPESNSEATWVRPELVCEVAFTGWTKDGLLRHPVFLRMREDKTAREVVREEEEAK